MTDSFPRSKDIPKQSPLFWVMHKDRYLRQQLIQDIQDDTGRELIVYYTDTERTDARIDQGDDQYLYELLKHRKHEAVDLLLETNGGFTDPTEKICSVLRQLAPDLRVIVPRRAKSNGTVIALCGKEILMSATSELGPIDPHLNGTPVEFVLNAEPGTVDPILVQIANTFMRQTKKLAKHLLRTGMMSSRNEDEISEVVDSLASRDKYHSHGSVIDALEARSLGLNATNMSADDTLWKKIWLLRTMYAYDCGRNGHAKLFEGVLVSAPIASTQAVASQLQAGPPPA
jgi:ClpP class serine protease